LQSIGQAFTLLPIIILAVSNSDPARATSFAAYIQIMRLGGAEIGVALMEPGCACASRSFQLSRTASRKRQRRCDARAQAALRFLCQPRRRNSRGAGGGNAFGQVAREANTLAYIDGFWLCFWLAMARCSSRR